MGNLLANKWIVLIVVILIIVALFIVFRGNVGGEGHVGAMGVQASGSANIGQH